MFASAEIAGLLFFVAGAAAAFADELLFQYEGNVLPATDGQPGWVGDGCDGSNCCIHLLQDGHYVQNWINCGEFAGYAYDIARSPKQPPPSLWVELNFRSNQTYTTNYICDGSLHIQYGQTFEVIHMFADRVFDQSGDNSVGSLEPGDFHTYRYESPDGVNYQFSVDGIVFRVHKEMKELPRDLIFFQGLGGCGLPTTNEWDFVRFGTIASGEQIVGSDPPCGFLDARDHPALDRFTIRYDSPNYVYIDEITVEVDGSPAMGQGMTPLDPSWGEETDPPESPLVRGEAPVVIATRRLDNGPPDVVEIVLDRPIPFGMTTRFTFDDGTLAQSLEFTYAPGDADGDGRATLADYAYLSNCFSQQPLTGPCLALDADASGTIDLADYAAFVLAMP